MVAPLSWLSGRWRRRRDMRYIARSGMLDAAWYRQRYPDIASADAPHNTDPLFHYVVSGCHEGRFPNPIFDTAWYLAEYLPADTRTNALIDYLRVGWRRGRRPNPWLDPAWYRNETGLAESAEPMGHYLAAGRDAAAPGPALDVEKLKRDYPDLGGDGSPLGFMLNSYRIVGDIDTCRSYYVAGWASRRLGPEMVVTVNVNGRPVGEVRPWIERPDVKTTLGREALGFFFRFPVRLAHGDRVVLRDELGQTIIGCEQTYEVPALDSTTDFFPNRAAIAATFLKGRGVEIGAFSQPNDLPPDREIAFYDRYPAEKLAEVYDKNSGKPLMEPSYIGDAETLDGLPDKTFDFAIANHVIEHLQDPIQFLKSVSAKLAPGGRAMITAPDKRFCMDKPRSLTPFDHLVEDHEKGPALSQRSHHLRYFMEAGGQSLAQAEASTNATDMDDIRFHYHVWDADTFVSFVESTIEHYELPLARIHTRATEADIIVVVEKAA